MAKTKLSSNTLSLFSAFGVYLKYYKVRYQSNSVNADDHESSKGKNVSFLLEKCESSFERGF